MTDYAILCEQLKSLIQGVPFLTANLANASALLWQELPDLNWAGFYLRRGEELVLGPFQGKPACIRIPWGKGVCGTAAKTGLTQRVENVHDFPGHIACDCASYSEIVVPFRCGGQVFFFLKMLLRKTISCITAKSTIRMPRVIQPFVMLWAATGSRSSMGKPNTMAQGWW